MSMSFLSKVGKVVRSVYDATSSSKSSFGRKFGRYVPPFNGPYFIRDAWRKYGKGLFGRGVGVANSAGVSSAGSARTLVGNTGFHRYT